MSLCIYKLRYTIISLLPNLFVFSFRIIMCPLVMDCFMYYNLLSHPPFQYLYCPDSSSGRFFHLIPAPSLVFEPFLLVVLSLFLLAFFSPFSFFSPPLHLSLPGTLCTSSLPALGVLQRTLVSYHREVYEKPRPKHKVVSSLGNTTVSRPFIR